MVPVCQKIWKDTRFPSSFAPIDKYPYASEFVIQIYKIFISTDFYIFTSFIMIGIFSNRPSTLI
jgi:hypothetical protein